MAKHLLTAVIYDRKGNVLSIGQNNYVKSHPHQAKHAHLVGMDERIYLHAEIHAIVKCKNLHKAHRMFVSRWDKNGLPQLAKPCPVCDSAIKAAGIEVVQWTV